MGWKRLRSSSLIMIVDIHTHSSAPTHQAIVNVEPLQFNPVEGQLYSVGIHPWNSTKIDADYLKLLDKAVSHPTVVAIGETGVDALRGASKECQIELFKYHIGLSEQIQKPIVIHAVRTYNDIIMLHKLLSPRMAWVIHGFRGNVNVARKLLSADILLSFGEYYNSESLIYTPIDKMFVETDESKLSIDDIYQKIAKSRGITAEELKIAVANNCKSIFYR